jgi:hypothetical protein
MQAFSLNVVILIVVACSSFTTVYSPIYYMFRDVKASGGAATAAYRAEEEDHR